MGSSGRRLRITLRILSFVAVIATAATPAHSGNISLSMTPRPVVANGALGVSVTIRNGGDEAARSVSPVLGFLHETTRGEVRPLLRPSESWEVAVTVPAPGLATGRWPYRLMVDYADANEYPFHALHVGTVTVGAVPPIQVAVIGIDAPPLARSGRITARVKNLSATPRQVSVTIHLPDGVEVMAPPPPVDLDAWEERAVAASLVNHTGLPGSRYAVFVSAEYDDAPMHQAIVVPATVEIVAPQSVFERWRTTLWLGAGLLIVGWGIAIGWWLLARRKA